VEGYESAKWHNSRDPAALNIQDNASLDTSTSEVCSGRSSFLSVCLASASTSSTCAPHACMHACMHALYICWLLVPLALAHVQHACMLPLLTSVSLLSFTGCTLEQGFQFGDCLQVLCSLLSCFPRLQYGN
jgi:hypothetical protein